MLSRPAPLVPPIQHCRVPSPLVCILALLVPLGPAAARANVLTNGSFEDNSGFVERDGFPRLDDLNGSAPSGWTRDTNTLAVYLKRSPLYQGVTLYNPADGDYFIGAHGGEFWEQTFPTTPGITYELTYSAAYGAAWWEGNGYYRPGSTPGLVTVTGNSSLFSGGLTGSNPGPTGATPLDSPIVWNSQRATFTADGNSATVRFAGPENTDLEFVFIDNAIVSAVPEPPMAVTVTLLTLLPIRRRR